MHRDKISNSWRQELVRLQLYVRRSCVIQQVGERTQLTLDSPFSCIWTAVLFGKHTWSCNIHKEWLYLDHEVTHKHDSHTWRKCWNKQKKLVHYCFGSITKKISVVLTPSDEPTPKQLVQSSHNSVTNVLERRCWYEGVPGIFNEVEIAQCVLLDKQATHAKIGRKNLPNPEGQKRIIQIAYCCKK
jgi:hypothetical protein